MIAKALLSEVHAALLRVRLAYEVFGKDMDDLLIEVRPPKIDMGSSLPLRCKLSLCRRKDLFYLVMGGTLFTALPLFYALDQKQSFQIFITDTPGLLILGAVGFLCFVTAIRLMLMRVVIEINHDKVTVNHRSFLHFCSETESIENYSGIWGFEIPLSDSRSRKTGDCFQIHLMHKSEPEKSILMYSGTKREIWKQRIVTYQGLLRVDVIDKIQT